MVKLFDTSIIGTEARDAVDFIIGILQASTEYSIIGKDLDGKILLWNEGAKRNYGYEPEEVVGKLSADILHTPEDIKAGKPKEMREIALREGKWEGVVTRVRKNGEQFKAHVVLTPRFDVFGTPLGFLLISKDLTEESKFMEELKEKEFFARSLLDSNVDSLIVIDLLGVITDANHEVMSITGYKREEIIGKRCQNFFFHPSQVEEGIRKVLRYGEVRDYELEVVAKDGRKVLVSFNGKTFHDTKGKLQGIIVSARDITEQKKLEKQLSDSANYYRGLIAASLDGLITIDPNEVITDVNNQMCHMTGYSREELLGSLFPNYFVDSKKASSGVQETFAKGSVKNYILILERANQQTTTVSFNATVFKNQNGELQGIFASARDVDDIVLLEEKLVEQKTYLRGLIESSVDGLMTVDFDGLITDVNRRMCLMSGYSREELLSTLFKNYFTDSKYADQGIKKIFSKGLVSDYRLTLINKNGEKTTISLNASIFKNVKDEIQGVFASARDITEQATLQEKLFDQQVYNRSLIESSADAMFVISGSGIITDVNEAAVQITGFVRKRLIGSSFANYFIDPEVAKNGVEKTFSENKVLNYELSLKSNYDQDIDVSFNASVYTDSSGNKLGILASARDIRSQKELEKSLRNNQYYARSLIEANIDALLTMDPIGIIMDVNEHMTKLVAVPREQLIGTPFKDYFTDPDLAAQGLCRALKDKHITDYELTAKAKTGKETAVSCNATTFYDQSGILLGVFVAAHDMTEYKLSERKLRTALSDLERSNKELEQFAYVASHDLQEPLRMISSYTELLANRYKGQLGKEADEFISYAVDGANRMQHLINDLLEFSRVTSKMRPFKPADVNKILKNALLDLQERIKERDAVITSEVLPVVTADEIQIARVFYNLISNSLKFCDRIPKIHVGFKEQDKDWVFFVKDNGVGIEEKYFDRIFVVFQRLHGKSEYPGTGIGLPICKKIVERHRGKIWVASKIGKGSTFYFSIPKKIELRENNRVRV